MRAGKLRQWGVIQRLVDGSPGYNAGGEPDGDWSEYYAGWCDVRPLQGRELFAAQQVVSEATGQVLFRYVSGVTSKMRFLLGSRIYDIIAVINTEERNVELKLYVKEGLNNG